MKKWFIKNKNSNQIFQYLLEINTLDFNTDQNISYIEFYMGRPSIYGNPYSHLSNILAKFKTKTRDEAIKCYETLYLPTIKNEICTLAQKINLTNQHVCLSCFCVPKPCHCFSIIKYINNMQNVEQTKHTEQITLQFT